MKRLLLVTYYYPPLAGPGVFRPLRLSKYLPRVGWDVTVLTVSARARVIKDPGLARDVPPEVAVQRTLSIEPRTLFLALKRLGLGRLVARAQPWFMVPDDQLGWTPLARRRGRKILASQAHDAIVSTAGPYSAHLVGLGLQRASGLPWVADFRDEWTTNPYLKDRYPTAWHRRLNLRLERRVVGCADRVTCVSEPWLHALSGAGGAERPSKFICLPNGFDAEHFRERNGPAPRTFRIVYTGTFYGHRSPTAFLAALRQVVEGGRIPPGDCEVVFMGSTSAVAPLDLHVGEQVARMLRIVEHRPYFEALALLEQAALLLLIVPAEGGAGNHTGKLFPYLAAGRPILALAPEGNVAADLVRRTNSGIVAPPDAPDLIADALVTCYEAWKRGAPFAQDRPLIETYEAHHQAQQWTQMLNELIGDRKGTVD